MYIHHNDHERKTNSFDVYKSETIITVSDTQIHHNDHERKTNSFDVYKSETIITVSDTQIHTPYPWLTKFVTSWYFLDLPLTYITN